MAPDRFAPDTRRSETVRVWGRRAPFREGHRDAAMASGVSAIMNRNPRTCPKLHVVSQFVTSAVLTKRRVSRLWFVVPRPRWDSVIMRLPWAPLPREGPEPSPGKPYLAPGERL
jgi:hypothetical protein